jgi:sentrin-specific protease 7
LLVDEDPIRWTDQNHEWAKEFQQSLIYPPTGKNRTTVDKDDIYRLDDGEFLNDNLINFWIRYLQHTLEAENPAMLKRVYFFSTFFFEKLRYSNGRIDYDGVKSWTSKVDVFSYDYLAIVCKPGKLLPQVSGSDKEAEEPSPTPAKVAVIGKQLSEVRLADANAQSTEPNFPEQHPPGFSGRTDQDRCVKEAMEKQVTIKSKQDPDRPRIVTLDSLGSAHPKTCGALKTYLIAEAKDKKKLDDITLPSGFTAKSIPQQDNWCDCGIYVLAYVEQFLQSPDESLQRILLKEPTGWKVHAPEKRKSIRQLIFVLQKRQQEEAELEKAAKQARRRAKVKAKEAAVPANAVTELRESVEGDTTSVLKGVNGQPPRQADAKASNSQRNTVELTYGSPRRANGLLAVSEPVSQGRSPERDGSKGPSSSNSFHTANSSPALGDSTETGFQASEAKPDKLDQSGEVEIRLSPSRKEEVVMIEGLPSSPSSAVQNVETPSAKKRKRKRSQGPDVSPAAPLRRRKLVEQIADSRTTPKESIEVQDDDNSQPESGAKYDGIDRRRAD